MKDPYDFCTRFSMYIKDPWWDTVEARRDPAYGLCLERDIPGQLSGHWGLLQQLNITAFVVDVALVAPVFIKKGRPGEKQVQAQDRYGAPE
jgi:hypothetical protein